MAQYKVTIIVNTDKDADQVRADLVEALPYLKSYCALDASLIGISDTEEQS